MAFPVPLPRAAPMPSMQVPAAVGRRELLRVGALSILGCAGGDAFGRRVATAATATPPADGWQRQCIFILLQGGASHIDLWDPKPRAVAEIRGPPSEIRPAECTRTTCGRIKVT